VRTSIRYPLRGRAAGVSDRHGAGTGTVSEPRRAGRGARRSRRVKRSDASRPDSPQARTGDGWPRTWPRGGGGEAPHASNLTRAAHSSRNKPSRPGGRRARGNGGRETRFARAEARLTRAMKHWGRRGARDGNAFVLEPHRRTDRGSSWRKRGRSSTRAAAFRSRAETPWNSASKCRPPMRAGSQGDGSCSNSRSCGVRCADRSARA